MCAKTVVLVARAFAPVKAIAVERVSKIARSFSQEGWKVIVVTIDQSDIKQEFFDDSRMEFIQRHNIEVIRTRYRLKDTFYLYKSSGSFKSYALKAVGRVAFSLGFDNSIGWIVDLTRKLQEITDERKIDLIVSSGSPFVSFYATYKVAKSKKIPYVLDFRDLWYAQPHSRRNFIQNFMIKCAEKMFMDSAALVTTVSDGCRIKLGENTTTKQINVLYNLPDLEYIDEIVNLESDALSADIGIDNSFFNLVYTGTLYEGRDLTSIAAAICLLDPQLRKNLRVHYFGSRGDVAIDNFQNYNLEHLVVVHGNVPKKTALLSLYQADLLISVIHNDIISQDESVRGIVTTKIFDYIIINKPVINVAPQDSEIRDLLQKIDSELVRSCSSDELEQISSFIQQVASGDIVNTYQPDMHKLDWHRACVTKLIEGGF